MADPPALGDLSLEERSALAEKLLQEQVIEQRVMLHYWRGITKQPAQIDTGYVGQHLVSLVTGIEGGGFRGKGLDLADNSEVKSANFLDSLDARGAVAPRWNFMSNNLLVMEALLKTPAIYLVSIDVNAKDKVRARIWRLEPKAHKPFAARYREWMEKLGKPKLKDPNRPYANFQLFPPRNRSDDAYARHGRGGSGPFTPLRVELEDGVGSHKIFHAEEDASGVVRLPVVKP